MTHSKSVRAFSSGAGSYDSQRRQLIPPFDRFYGAAVEAVGLALPGPVGSVLDLGAGTGLLSRMVRAGYPGARLTLLDGSQEMLDQARTALGVEGVEYVLADLADPLPPSEASGDGDGHWDAVVSALAIHHLSDGDKRGLLRRVRAALRDGGVFVNAEQVTGPSDFWTSLYERRHAEGAAALGTSTEEWAAALERMRHDRCAPVAAQLAWLREAGFAEVDCVFQDHRFAVFVALA